MVFVSAFYLSLTLSPKSTLSEVSILPGCNAALTIVSKVSFFFASLFEEVLIFPSNIQSCGNFSKIRGSHWKPCPAIQYARRLCYMPAVKTEVMSSKTLPLLYKHYMISVVIKRIRSLVLFIGQPGLIQLDRAVAVHKYHFVRKSAPSPVAFPVVSNKRVCQPLAAHNKGST